MKLKYSSWEQINLQTYNEIKKIVTDTDLQDIDKNAELLAILYDLPVDDIYKLKVSQIQNMLRESSFITELPKPKKLSLKHIVINGKKYDIVTDISKYTVAQYVDFQTLVKKGDEYAANILATIIIPQGYAYGDDYDINKVVEEINNYLPATLAISLVFFYTKKLMNSTNRTAIFLEAMTMTTKKEKKTEKLWKKVKKNLRKMRHIFG